MALKFPFFDLTRQYPQLKEEIEPILKNIFAKQAFVMGEEVLQFEKEIAQYIGVKNAITCGSGTDALVLALKALDIGPGDEVITTPFSFFASTSAILLSGATPVFCDIDSETFNIDPQNLKKVLTPRTKAILPVHLFGHMAEMGPILEFAKAHGLYVVEDAAQSLGARSEAGASGAIGTIGTTSFYPTKNLGGAGEGGLVMTQDDALAEKLKYLRVHGMKVRYTHEFLGWNSRMDAIQAAVLRVKLRHLDSWVKRRQELAARYGELLAPMAKKGAVKLPSARVGNFHVWNQYTILVDRRDQVRTELEGLGIPTDIFYPKTIPVQPALKAYSFDESKWPVAVKSAVQALALPIFPDLTFEEQDQVIQALNKVLEKPVAAGISYSPSPSP